MKWVYLTLANRIAKIMTISQTLNLSAIGPDNPASNSHPLVKPMLLCRCSNKQILNAKEFGHLKHTQKRTFLESSWCCSDFSGCMKAVHRVSIHRETTCSHIVHHNNIEGLTSTERLNMFFLSVNNIHYCLKVFFFNERHFYSAKMH